MPVSKLLLAAYEVPTVFRKNMPRRQDLPSLLTAAVAGEVKEGAPGSLREEVLARAAHLERVLNAARKTLGAIPEDTLPVFLVPEYFFRHPERPYTHGEFFACLDALAAWSERAPEWLLIPGSIWWDLRVPTPMANPGQGPTVPQVSDTGLMLYGGRVVHARLNPLPFGADGLQFNGPGTYLQRDSLGMVVADRHLQAIWQLMAEEEASMTCHLVPPNLDTSIRGWRVGMEVGLEHLSGTLYEDLDPRTPGVDVHVLTSCGIPLLDFHIAARNGGCFLRCDGAYREEGNPATAPASDAIRVLRRGNLICDWVDDTMRAPVLQRLTSPVDGMGERLRAACQKHQLVEPALVLHEPLEPTRR